MSSVLDKRVLGLLSPHSVMIIILVFFKFKSGKKRNRIIKLELEDIVTVGRKC